MDPNKEKPMVRTLRSTSSVGTVKAQVTLSHGPNFAQYNPGRKRWTFTLPTMTSADQFSIETITITEGAMKGHQALVLVPVPKKQFRFLDLPPEIRNMIYRDVFAEQSESVDKPEANIHGVEDKHMRCVFSAGKTAVPVSMLLANRQLHREAAPVLYGCNKFRFRHSRSLDAFLLKIGSERILLRDIEIYGVWRAFGDRAIKGAVRMMAEIKGLQRFHLAIYSSGYHEAPAKRVATFLRPLFEMLFKREKALAKVLEVVTHDQARRGCPAHADLKADPKNCEDCPQHGPRGDKSFRKELRSEIRRYCPRKKI